MCNNTTSSPSDRQSKRQMIYLAQRSTTNHTQQTQRTYRKRVRESKACGAHVRCAHVQLITAIINILVRREHREICLEIVRKLKIPQYLTNKRIR